MRSFGSGSLRKTSSALLLATLTTAVAWMASGCGQGVLAGPSNVEDPAVAYSLTGHAMGGETPIIGATATLWETATTGVATTSIAGGYYAGAATSLQTVTTNSTGGFTFNAANGCSTSASDDYYITIQGGNSGGTQSNPNILLMAAIGNCTQLLATPFVDVNEVTTVAAAYALQGFISLSSSTTGGVTTNAVNITASAHNYATSASSVGTTYHPIGLQHAFLNAANLANVTTGSANAQLPGAATNAALSNVVMPNAVINSVANVLLACTNSNGATPEITFTSTAPSSGAGAVLTSNTIGASDTINGTLTLRYAGGSAFTVGPYSGAAQSTVAAAIQSANSNLTASWTSGVLTITGQPGTSNTLVVSVTDAQYSGSGVASALLDVPATPNTCGSILAAAVPLNSTTGAANTMQAALNVVRNPYMGAAGAAATFINTYQSAAGSPLFSPTISVTGAGTTTAIPHDLSAAIIYPVTQIETAEGGSIGYYNSMATLDANDNFYFLTELTGTTPYYFNLTQMSSNGAFNYTHAFCGYNVYSQTAVPGTSCPEVLINPAHLVADALGNLYISITSSTAVTSTYVTTQSGVIQLNASTGAFANIPANTASQESIYPVTATAAYIYSLALDQNNNLWVGADTTTSPVYRMPYQGSNTMGTGTEFGIMNRYAYQLVLDANQNVFAANYGTTVSTYPVGPYVVPNQALPANTYPQSSSNATLSTVGYGTGGTSALTHTSYGTTTDYGEGVAVDSAGNVYSNTGTTGAAGGGPLDGIYVSTPIYSQAGSGTYNGDYYVSGFTQLNSTPIEGAYPSLTNGLINIGYTRSYWMQTDGAGAIWVADVYDDVPIRFYGTGGTSILGFYPCVGSTCYNSYPGTSTYTTQTSVSAEPLAGLYGSKEVYIDSTGTVWDMCTNSAATSGTDAGNIAQIFGVAAPTFPLLQAGHPGQMP